LHEDSTHLIGISTRTWIFWFLMIKSILTTIFTLKLCSYRSTPRLKWTLEIQNLTDNLILKINIQ
jgi:hypothetical protein